MISSRLARVGVAAVCAAMVLFLPAVGGAQSAGPGAPGAGDDYFPGYGNGGYDVSHYNVRLRYQPDTDELAGTTTIVASPTHDLTRFNLDFALTVHSVRVNGLPAEFVHNGIELVVTPRATLPAGSLMTVVVQYSGIPSQVVVDGFTSWTRTVDGALAVNEPEIAWWWFPSNDHPTDKATFDISVAVPTGTEVLSNGRLVSRVVQPGDLERWNWRSTRPMATYLAFIAVGQFEIHTGVGAGGQPFITAYSDGLGEHENAAKASIERTPEIVEFLSQQYGPYPVEAQGGVATLGPGFALETQTRPVYDGVRFFQAGANTYVVAHELAHQWFGDSVAVAEWRNIWLNEGFARYSEWLWSEANGEGTAQEHFDFQFATRPATDPFWQVLPGDPGPNRMFNIAVYNRGAMTLHALRTVVGDDAFFQIMRGWAAQHQHGNGTIEEYIALAEQTSGQQLDELFTTWLYTAGRPAVSDQLGVPASAARAVVPEPKSAAAIARVEQALHPAR